MTAAESAYLSSQAEEYVERIHRKAQVHSVRLRVEAQAALHASLAVLLQAMRMDGDQGRFRAIVNECVSEIVDREHQFSPERPVS